jgi:Uma2 family endonuclease
MTLAPIKRRFTPAEYYALEHEAEYKSDYYDGEIFNMSGGTATHSLISGNIVGELRQRLKGKPCTVYESNMRLKIEASSLRTYPDASVYCEPLRFDPEDPRNTTAVNPTVVFEVLSPSTEAYDRGLKARNYRLVTSLKAYGFVAKDRPYVELHVRQSSGEWAIRDVQGMEASVPLVMLSIELPLSEIYDRVDFSADLSPTEEKRS